jgi:hypothetical protein
MLAVKKTAQNGALGMLIKRLLIASDLALRFFSKPATLTIAAIPIVLWPLKRLFFARTSPTADLVLLLVIYFVIVISVLAWKFVEARHVVKNGPAIYAELEKLDAQEQNELRRLIRSGKMRVGPAVFERIGAKTDFIYRNESGEWRMEWEYKRFLKDWEKSKEA